MTPEEAVARLKAGNERYRTGAPSHADRCQDKRKATVASQSPYAIAVGCSDSRVPLEIIFDEGIGDLFVVRNAGNVIASVAQDSIDFAAVYLGSSVIVVMGHENCGAVSAVIAEETKDIEVVAEIIQPSVTAEKALGQNNLLERSVKRNAKRMRDQLKENAVLEELIKEKKIDVYAAYYHLVSGLVEFLN